MMLLACTNLAFNVQFKGRKRWAIGVHVVQGRIDGTTGHRTRISGTPRDLL